MTSGTLKGRLDVAEVKAAAENRWFTEILPGLGFAHEDLDGEHHPCPKCGGVDRFRAIDAQAGAVHCSQCFSEKNGDGLAAAMWWRGWSFPQALKAVAELVGVHPQGNSGHANGSHVDIVEWMALFKRVPIGSLRAFGAKPDLRNKLAVCRLPMFDENRNQCSYQDYADTNDEFRKGMSAKGKPAGLFVAEAEWPEPGDTVYIVEGCKDAGALHDFLKRHGLPGKVIGLPTSKMHEKYAKLFQGCDLILVPDLDQAGESGSDSSAGKLRGIAKSVKRVRLPGEFKLKDGDGVREILAKTDGDSLLLTALEAARTWEPTLAVGEEANTDETKPRIFCALNEKQTNDRIIEALAKDPAIFQRGGSLVRIIHEAAVAPGISRSPTAPSIQPLPEASVREAISKAVILQERRGEEIVPIRVPYHVSKAIHQRGQWDQIRKLEAVVRFPVLRADGTVAKTPGFDVATGLYLDITPGLVVMPDTPTIDHARRAVKILCELVSDFPFEKPAHRASWLAFVLTVLGRFTFNGPSPLFVVDANTRGSGKTLLAEIGSQITTGTDFARLAPCREDDEMRKRITAIAMRGDPVILLDNVSGDLGTPSLDSALTGTTWTDRVLGQSHQITLPLYAVWLATGNNIILAADTTRRVCHTRLSSSEERPEDRTEFQHADILGYVRANRPMLLSAALTILAAYFRAGRPPQQMRPWGSYEGWSAVVRQALIWAGEPDPAETREELIAYSDSGASLLSDLIAGWELADASGDGMTVADAIRKLEDQYCPDRLKDSVRGMCGLQPGKLPTAVSLGRHMRKHRRRVIGGKCLECRENRDGVMVWRVIRAGVAGEEGVISPQPISRENHI